MRTLNPDVDVILALFGLPSILVGFGEGVYNAASVSMLQGSIVELATKGAPNRCLQKEVVPKVLRFSMDINSCTWDDFGKSGLLC